MALFTLSFSGTASRKPASFNFSAPKAMTCPLEGDRPSRGAVAQFYHDFGAGIHKFSKLNDLDPAITTAVMLTESNGAYDETTGRAIIRVEARPPVISRLRWPDGGAEFQKKFSRYQNIAQKQQTVAQKQDTEWRGLTAWFGLSGATATDYTSYGLGQIMGNEFNRVKCKSSMEVLERAQHSAEEQVAMFFDFINHKVIEGEKLIEHARGKNWRLFTKGYNGPGQVDAYSKILIENYDSAVKVVAK